MLAPDLLEPVPRLRLDARLFSETLTFAFATGSEPGRPRHVGQTCVFGGAPKVVGQPPKHTGVRSAAVPPPVTTTAVEMMSPPVTSAPPAGNPLQTRTAEAR